MMDSFTLIWQALEMGAEAAARTVGSKVVKDAYEGFRTLLRTKLPRSSSDGLSKNNAKMSSDQKQKLKTALKEADVHKNQDIVDAAHKLMTMLDPQNASTDKYKVQIAGDVHGFVQGDHAQVKMTFGAGSAKSKK